MTDTETWTPQALKILTKMHANGDSFMAIATALCISRSAIAGKVRRMGLPRREREHAAVPKKRARKSRETVRIKTFEAKVAAKRRKVPAPIAPPDAAPVHLLKLRDFHCRSPVDQRGTDGLAMFCGNPVQAGKSWCPHHYKMYIDHERMKADGKASPREQ